MKDSEWDLELTDATAYFKVIQRKECFRLSSFFLEETNATSSCLFWGHNNCSHVSAKNFGDCKLIFFMDGVTQVHKSSKLEEE